MSWCSQVADWHTNEDAFSVRDFENSRNLSSKSNTFEPRSSTNWTMCFFALPVLPLYFQNAGLTYFRGYGFVAISRGQGGRKFMLATVLDSRSLIRFSKSSNNSSLVTNPSVAVWSALAAILFSSGICVLPSSDAALSWGSWTFSSRGTLFPCFYFACLKLVLSPLGLCGYFLIKHWGSLHFLEHG